LPLEGRRWELLDGNVVQMEPHGLDASALTASIMVASSRYVREHDLGVVLGAGCEFRSWPGHETVRVTDMSFTRHDRLPAERDRRDYPRWAPDLIVEVLSPFERTVTALDRITMFLRAGTTLVWLANPESRTLMIIQPDVAPMMLKERDTLDGGDVLPEFSVPVAEMFA